MVTTIKETASDKAPGLDGYVGTFYKHNWELIKPDLMLALNYFFQLHDQQFKHLNTTHIIILPKKIDAKEVGDFRPISPINSTTKLISKLLATRLSRDLNALVSKAQSAFFKRRNIQDNFLYTQNLIRALHKSKQPGPSLKLDIAKAFDSVNWDYLMEVLQQFDFGSRWRGWISALQNSDSTAIMLNGACGKWYSHFKGLRQGDPLSP